MQNLAEGGIDGNSSATALAGVDDGRDDEEDMGSTTSAKKAGSGKPEDPLAMLAEQLLAEDPRSSSFWDLWRKQIKSKDKYQVLLKADKARRDKLFDDMLTGKLYGMIEQLIDEDEEDSIRADGAKVLMIMPLTARTRLLTGMNLTRIQALSILEAMTESEIRTMLAELNDLDKEKFLNKLSEADRKKHEGSINAMPDDDEEDMGSKTSAKKAGSGKPPPLNEPLKQAWCKLCCF